MADRNLGGVGEIMAACCANEWGACGWWKVVLGVSWIFCEVDCWSPPPRIRIYWRRKFTWLVLRTAFVLLALGSRRQIQRSSMDKQWSSFRLGIRPFPRRGFHQSIPLFMLGIDRECVVAVQFLPAMKYSDIAMLLLPTVKIKTCHFYYWQIFVSFWSVVFFRGCQTSHNKNHCCYSFPSAGMACRFLQ